MIRPFWSSRDARLALHLGDCRVVMATLDANSIDSIVTDPPYELGFMGKAWDASGVAFDPATWREVLRVAKPGAHLLAFGGTRTYHRMVCAIEDAGWEIRDSIDWIYGSGFPKSHNLDGEHVGKGTALKPAHEPIVLARKPLIGTVAANVDRFGTGAINVDACRVGSGGQTTFSERMPANGARSDVRMGDAAGRDEASVGRWPPNVVLTHSADCRLAGTREVRTGMAHEPTGDRPRSVSNAPGKYSGRVTGHASANGTETVAAFDCAPDCPVALMDRQSGDLVTHGGSVTAQMAAMGFGGGSGSSRTVEHDRGGASRFFPTFEWDPFLYCAKATTSERDAGLEHRAKRRATSKINRGNGTGERFDGGPTAQRANIHPTVKPIALMRWLVRLVTPRDGVVLDPFVGSGTTIVAARQENVRALGIELSPEYVDLARDRIVGDSPLLNAGGAA